MAKTQGHGNPAWNRDETILALNLYFEVEGVPPSPDDQRVIELSSFLRALPYHSEASRRDSFRNAAGVAFKIQNLRSIATGKGLTNVSATDRAVWEQLGNSPERVSLLAAAIRSGVEAIGSLEPDEDEQEFAEGRLLTMLHKRRERSRKVRSELLKLRRAAGPLRCELCEGGSRTPIASFEEAEFEAHHMRPVSESTEGKTRLKDMALLCACCHRLLHKLMVAEKRLVPLQEARILLRLST